MVVAVVNLSKLARVMRVHVQLGLTGPVGASVLPNVMVVVNQEPVHVSTAKMENAQVLQLTNNNAIDNRVDAKCFIGIMSSHGPTTITFVIVIFPEKEPSMNSALLTVSITMAATG